MEIRKHYGVTTLCGHCFTLYPWFCLSVFSFLFLCGLHKVCICCGSILSFVQNLFPLFQTHYHQITITKTKEIKFEPRIKLNHNLSICHDRIYLFVYESRAPVTWPSKPHMYALWAYFLIAVFKALLLSFASVGPLSRTQGDPWSLHQTGGWLSAWYHVHSRPEASPHPIFLSEWQRQGKPKVSPRKHLITDIYVCAR